MGIITALLTTVFNLLSIHYLFCQCHGFFPLCLHLWTRHPHHQLSPNFVVLLCFYVVCWLYVACLFLDFGPWETTCCPAVYFVWGWMTVMGDLKLEIGSSSSSWFWIQIYSALRNHAFRIITKNFPRSTIDFLISHNCSESFKGLMNTLYIIILQIHLG